MQAIGSVFRDIGNRISSLVSNVNSSIDTLNDFSARTGIGVESLQGYSLAAKLAGVDTEQFQSAVQKLAVNISKAAPGNALDKSLRGINLSVAELRALAPEEQFSTIGSAISQLPTAADRAAAAVEIFGEQGAALAPLFREGAASIEELQARAERLGVIVSETQVGNVADMNDAFDLVLATVQGITGQVLGNLAPAVTDVTNQFLKFVESWSGAQGEGGTGIANAITDVLLQGAEYFASIFDKFVQDFGGLAGILEAVASAFAFTADVLTGLSATFSAIFNTFELIGNGIALSLGNVLKGIGSFVSSDLEQLGADIAANAQAQIDKNVQQLSDAGKQLGNAVSGALSGGDGNAQNAGQGAASQYLAGLRAGIENARLPEVQIKADLEQTEADLQRFLSTATGETSKFLNQSTETLDTFQRMAAEGNLTADQIEIMNGFMQQLNGELVKEKKNREDAKNAATAQADADKKRIDELLKTTDAAQKIREDIAIIEREQSRLAQVIADPKSTEEQLKAAAAQAVLLEGTLGTLEEKLQATAQGFEKGFDESFAKTAEGIASLVLKAEEFGPAGAEAAQSLEDGIARAQALASAGILTGPAYELEIKRQESLFNKELKNIEDAAKERLKNEELVNGLINVQRFDGDNARAKAAENLLAIEQEIQLTQDAIAKSRDEGRKDEAMAAAKRLADLDQVKAKEQDIASGNAKKREEYQKAFEKQQQDAFKAQEAQQKQAQEEQKRIFEEQQKAAAAEAKRQDERLRKLNTLGQETISVTDVRNAESANLVLQLGAAAQDPALIQQRLQTKLLEKIAVGIGQAASNYFNQPVAIVGYANVGGI